MPDFIFTHVNQLIEIQELAIRRNYNEISDAGCEGVVRDGAMGWLESIIERPYWEPELKTDVIKYSAFVLYTIAARHPFGQANKRTAFAAAENCLLLCSLQVDANEVELEEFMLRVSKYSGSRQIKLVYLPWSHETRLPQKFIEGWHDALLLAFQKFKYWGSTPYQKYNQPALVKALIKN